MSTLGSRIARLERDLAPDPDDRFGFGLAALTIDEHVLFDRLLTAAIEGGDVATVAADLDPTTVTRFEIILGRAAKIEKNRTERRA